MYISFINSSLLFTFISAFIYLFFSIFFFAGQICAANVLTRQWEREIKKLNQKDYVAFYKEVACALENATGPEDDDEDGNKIYFWSYFEPSLLAKCIPSTYRWHTRHIEIFHFFNNRHIYAF